MTTARATIRISSSVLPRPIPKRTDEKARSSSRANAIRTWLGSTLADCYGARQSMGIESRRMKAISA